MKSRMFSMKWIVLVALAGCVGQIDPEPTPQQRQESKDEVQAAVNAADKLASELEDAGID